jgi:hypothetical protein
MKMLRIVSTGLLAGGLMFAVPAFAQQPQTPLAPESSEKQTAAAPTWTTEQLMTATVHDAWLLSGKNEATFFEMVTQLAQISAQKRGLTLPETQEAGRRAGAMIKKMAKADTDQLLYAVVDKAVKTIGVPAKS